MSCGVDVALRGRDDTVSGVVKERKRCVMAVLVTSVVWCCVTKKMKMDVRDRLTPVLNESISSRQAYLIKPIASITMLALGCVKERVRGRCHSPCHDQKAHKRAFPSNTRTSRHNPRFIAV